MLIFAQHLTSGLLASAVQVDKSAPYFEVQTPTGIILGGQTQQLLVRYHPKAMGKHSAQLPFIVCSELGKEVQRDTLSVTGSSLRQGDKVAPVGGIDKLPGDFEKPGRYVDADQVRCLQGLLVSVWAAVQLAVRWLLHTAVFGCGLGMQSDDELT